MRKKRKEDEDVKLSEVNVAIALDAGVDARLFEKLLNTAQWARYRSECVAAVDKYHAIVDTAYAKYQSIQGTASPETVAAYAAEYKSVRDAAATDYKLTRNAILSSYFREENT